LQKFATETDGIIQETAFIRWAQMEAIMRVTYRHMRPRSVLYVRTFGPYEHSTADAWAIMRAWLKQGQALSKCHICYGIYRDNPSVTPAELRRYDACVPLLPEINLDRADLLDRQILPGGSYASCTYFGVYNPLGAMFSPLHHNAIAKRGLRVDYERAFMAIYLHDPITSRGAYRRTEVCVPVSPIRMPVAGNDVGDRDAAVSNCASTHRLASA
jgi:AraC family transcriptional regulator